MPGLMMRKSLFWKNASHCAPPPYPSTPDEIAAERAKAEQEEAAAKAEHEEIMVQMAEGELRQYEFWTNRFAELARKGEEIDWDRWLPDDMTTVKNYIDQISDKVRIADLTSRFEELRSKAAAARRQAEEEESDGFTGNKGVRATAAAEAKARRYLEEQVKLKIWLPKPDHFAAARAICGESLSE